MDSIVRLAHHLPRLDLLLLFAEDMDLTRNLQQMLADLAKGQRVNAVLGDGSWRELYDPAKRDQHTARRVRELYVDRLKTRAGFKYVGEPFQVRNSKNVPLYVLLYATRHDLGLKLWTDITKPDQLSFI
jgi:three-Cys-motif partner protein